MMGFVGPQPNLETVVNVLHQNNRTVPPSWDRPGELAPAQILGLGLQDAGWPMQGNGAQ